MPSFDFTLFNILEGAFWISLSIFSLVLSYTFYKNQKTMWRLLSVDFILFGVSDFAEVYLQESFFTSGFEWLFIWKGLCIGFFVIILVTFLIQKNRN